ncbi:hypothetical protein PIB30_022345 [Stylosanthes scabra]|uniref:Ribosomal RNA-processing protein 43 n=1 Tax=Stylosanthes scabra TaxID=79078 RepID=A0ABU6V7G0_9FABA|nr:hypothetical protein [Stylosanthes scabra]
MYDWAETRVWASCGPTSPQKGTKDNGLEPTSYWASRLTRQTPAGAAPYTTLLRPSTPPPPRRWIPYHDYPIGTFLSGHLLSLWQASSYYPSMGFPDASKDLSSEMEVDAFRRLFPLQYFERHLSEAIRPDGRPLGKARDTTVVLGAVASANGSALVKIGSTTMLSAIKMEVMTPSLESPDEGCLAIDFHMPPICSPIVRPGRPAEAAPVLSKQLSDTISSSGIIDLKELSLVTGKAAWMAYLDVYCLDADGALFDAALLSAVAALSHLQIPAVSMNDDGKIVLMSDDDGQKQAQEPVNNEKRNLTLRSIPFSLTCILHKNYILDCVALTRQRVKELKGILEEANSTMQVE